MAQSPLGKLVRTSMVVTTLLVLTWQCTMSQNLSTQCADILFNVKSRYYYSHYLYNNCFKITVANLERESADFRNSGAFDPLLIPLVWSLLIWPITTAIFHCPQE